MKFHYDGMPMQYTCTYTFNALKLAVFKWIACECLLVLLAPLIVDITKSKTILYTYKHPNLNKWHGHFIMLLGELCVPCLIMEKFQSATWFDV